MKNSLMIVLSIFAFSCQQKENKNASFSTSDTIEVKKNSEENHKEATEENKQIGDTIFMKIKNERNVFAAEGKLDSVHSKIYVKFKNEDLGELTANIFPSTGEGNIRFNQIIFPDNSSDGPFGMDLQIQLKQKGNYILVIGHSLMADNPYFGAFKVQLETNKTK